MQKRIPCIYTYGKGSFKIAIDLAYAYLYMWHMHIYVCMYEGGKRESTGMVSMSPAIK